MKITNIDDLLPLLNRLKDSGIWFRLSHVAHDCLMVDFTLVGARVEVTFSPEGVGYSVFTGDESVRDDWPALFAMIADFRQR